MNDSLYRDHLLDHYHRPRNYGLRDGFGIEARGSNPLCGDSLTIRLKVDNSRIADICFESQGCVISRASASLLGQYIIGKSPAEILAIKPDVVLGLLGVAIMPARLKCALLALETVKRVL